MQEIHHRRRGMSAARLGAFAVALAILFLFRSAPIESAPPATTYSVLYKFTNTPDGAFPVAAITVDSAGDLYGTTYGGGSIGYGTVFKLDSSGNETVLFSFSQLKDGATPAAGVIRDASGNLYGTTPVGGLGRAGVVFMLDTTGKETAIHEFLGALGDGASPYGELIQDASGNLYGTTAFGGTSEAGQIFKMNSPDNMNWSYARLYNFTGGKDGGFPYAGLVMDAAGNLYGTTRQGGAASCDCGVVFKLDSSNDETVLFTFTAPKTGESPTAGVTLDSAGNIYGTTSEGGNSKCNGGKGCGVVFKLDKLGNEGVLHHFTGKADGGVPFGGVILDSAGNLYGLTSLGGDLKCNAPLGCGVIFKIDPSGNETVLHTFTGPDGATPEAGLTRDAAGNLYGATYNGGDISCGFGSGCGVVFKLSHQ